MKNQWIWRVFFYLFGLVLLAGGICLNKKVNLGISPIVSVADCASQLTIERIPFMTLANATFLLYSLFVVIEIIIHIARKKYKAIPADLFQLAVSLVFTRFMSIFEKLIPSFTQDLQGTVFDTLAMRILFLVIAVILTGIGAAMSLNARLVPNPGDGIVQAISECIKKSTGFTKNCFDITCVITSTAIGLAIKHTLVGVGIGTVVAMIGVGRVIAAYNILLKKKTDKLSGMGEN